MRTSRNIDQFFLIQLLIIKKTVESSHICIIGRIHTDLYEILGLQNINGYVEAFIEARQMIFVILKAAAKDLSAQFFF